MPDAGIKNANIVPTAQVIPADPLSLPQDEQDRLLAAQGKCPECGQSIAAICPKCGAPGMAGAKFCAMCGTPVPATASPEIRRAHAETHWGKDFHLTKANEYHAADVKAGTDPWKHGVVHDEKLFPHAVRRWHLLVD
jgi:hypothetical protein